MINLFNRFGDEKDSFENVVLSCGQLEEFSSKIWRNLSENTKNHQEHLVYKFLSDMLSSLDLVLNSKIKINRSQRIRSGLVEDLIPSDMVVGSTDALETFSLKMNCFSGCLQFIQGVLRIEKVYYINRRLNDLNIDSDDDSEE